MTKRTRSGRQQPPARRRPQPRPATAPGGATPGAPGGGLGGAGASAREEPARNGGAAVEKTAAAPVAATAPAGARRVGRLDPAGVAGRRTTKAQQKQQSSFPPLDPEDPAIPFDRVPYVPADLRRVAIMAGFMVVLIMIAAVVVTHTVG
jgi:hypothetical protein